MTSASGPPAFEPSAPGAPLPPSLSFHAGRDRGLPTSQRAPGDTLYFGYVDGTGHAVAGEAWTFDHGDPDPLEGWYSLDITQQADTYFRHLDTATWDADPRNVVPAPVLRGLGSAWVGVFGTEAYDLCWDGGLGYGIDWCQRLVSPVFVWDGSSDVDVRWVHFGDTEDDFDYSLVYLRTLPGGDETLLRRYTGQVGLAPDHPASPPTGAPDSLTLTVADFGGAGEFQLVFAMTSDGTWSDEDALYPTEYGPCSWDDVLVEGVGTSGSDTFAFGFEADLEGWTPEGCAPIGSFLGVASLTEYTIEDACDCDLGGNVLEMHAGVGNGGGHPEGQHEFAVSPIVDVLGDVVPNLPGSGNVHVLASWDQYSVMPRPNGVFYRPGAYYYPWTCDVTGVVGWSPRQGQDTYYFVGDDPVCVGNLTDLSTVAGDPVPPGAEQVRFVYELYSSCDAFGIGSEDCSGVTNETPLLDNIQLAFTRVSTAPSIAFGLGLRYQDGYPQGPWWTSDMTGAGNADVTRNTVGFGNNYPFILGDSLQVEGPFVGSAETSWEARLWFRIPRVSPFAHSDYENWRDRVADGKAIDPELAGDGPVEFTWAYMDSSQLGTNAFRNKFCSYFREDDDDFDSGSAELTGGNEIIADGALRAGTQVEYFVTSNYMNAPNELFFLPDTAGGYFLEFEILPRWYDDGSQYKFPTVLYVDAFEGGAQSYIEEALGNLGERFDRYDYGDPTSNWKAPMGRGRHTGANNGISIGQLLGYRTILINSGSHGGSQLLWPEDFEMLEDWLDTSPPWPEDRDQQLHVNGNGLANAISLHTPSLLAKLGASHTSESYRLYSGDEALCVDLEAPGDSSAVYGTVFEETEYEYGAYANGCPLAEDFDVLAPAGFGSVGNRVFVEASTGNEVGFAQIAMDQIEENGVYRSVLDGVSWHRIALRDAEGGCAPSREDVVQAIEYELGAALEWSRVVVQAASVDDPGTDSGPATKLLTARPNPFPETTRLSFQLARAQHVEIVVFDAQGRRVRRLLDETRTAGKHAVIWDGSDDGGRSLPSGMYWYRMKTDGYERASRILRIR